MQFDHLRVFCGKQSRNKLGANYYVPQEDHFRVDFANLRLAIIISVLSLGLGNSCEFIEYDPFGLGKSFLSDLVSGVK